MATSPKSSKKARKKGRKKKPWVIRPGKLLFDLALCFLAFTVIPVLIYSQVNPPTTPLMWIRWAQQDYKEELSRAFIYWKPIGQISPNLIKAAIGAEDQKFFQHKGFDWDAIENALENNLKSDRRKLGASTISMQTARNVFLWQERSWFRKILESYFTVLMEVFWSKERILEVYLNVIEWGDGVYGAEEASRKYFNHSSDNLSPVESAWMAAILPNPRQWSLPGMNVESRQARILNVMKTVHLPHLG